MNRQHLHRRAAARNGLRVAVPLIGAALGAALGTVASAGPMSDTFQPDVFGTSGALQQRTQGLRDPLARACPAPAATLTLGAAIDLALCRNPATRSAWAAAHQQAAALGAAESAWLPSITATGGESRTLGPHVDASGLETDTPQNTSDAAVNLTWTLFDFGASRGRIRSARHLLDAAAYTVGSTAQQTVFNVVQGYYGVVAGDATVAAARATETTAARSLDAARGLQQGGAATVADVLQAETAHDEAVLARLQAERAAQSAYGTLAVILGLPADQALKVAADPVPSNVPALTARVSDLMTEANRQRPDLAAALAQRSAAEDDVTVARAAGRPSISVSAGRDWSNAAGLPVQSYGLVGVTLTIPIFSGFEVAYGVRQAQAALQASDVNAERVRLGVSLDVWNAYYALDSANKQLAETATLAIAAQRNQDVALGRYQSGVGTILDLLTAQSAAANARVLRINAELGWQIARAQLALALGRLSSAEPLAPGSPAP